jgi:Capsule assembly protein Wzi
MAVIAKAQTLQSSQAAMVSPHTFGEQNHAQSSFWRALSDASLSSGANKSPRVSEEEDLGSQNSGIPPSASVYDFDQGERREASTRTLYKASTFVPLDSWIYPSLDRLAAMGYMPSSTAILRPVTRLECARLLAVAHVHIDWADETTEQMLAALDSEFAVETGIIDGRENRNAAIDTTYSRLTQISGLPLRDGFHFAQSIVDDYGRPYGEGPNVITGFSGRAEYGPVAIYVDAEYQYASAIQPYSLAAQQALATQEPEPDNLPYGWNLRAGTTDRLRPLEAYATLDLHNWQLNFGQQALWWGADRSTSLILSNNAAAMPMLRLTRAKPLLLPLFGPTHFDVFIARQGGIHYVGLGQTFALYGSPGQALTPPPYIWGVAATFKLTKNLEVGFAHNTIFAGFGRPLTIGTFLHTFSEYGNAQAVDPGKRVTEWNFNYRVPFFKKSFSIFNEAMAWDDPIQGKFVARYAMDPGIYLPEVPKIKNLDLRLEAAYTDLPKSQTPAYFYYNAHYPQGYTNYGQILGSWVGRQGIGGQASSTYWFSPRKKVTLTYRKMISDNDLYRGGSMGELAASAMWTFRSKVEVSASGQYERWGFPLLGAGPKTNFTTTFGVRLFPELRSR